MVHFPTLIFDRLGRTKPAYPGLIKSKTGPPLKRLKYLRTKMAQVCTQKKTSRGYLEVTEDQSDHSQVVGNGLGAVSLAFVLNLVVCVRVLRSHVNDTLGLGHCLLAVMDGVTMLATLSQLAQQSGKLLKQLHNLLQHGADVG